MALTLLDGPARGGGLDVKILATDIDPNMVRRAEAATYDEEAVSRGAARAAQEGLGARARRRPPSWRMSAEVRDLVSCRELNLMAAWPMRGRFDAIFCRNVAIYFDEPTQERLWSRFPERMERGARLYIGHSERVSDPRFFSDGLTTYGLKKEKADEPRRVLVVDDSAHHAGADRGRAWTRTPGSRSPGFAGDPLEAREQIKKLEPDVVTLDVEMPNMNGIEFLEKIMRLRPMPVVMVSSLTQAGADITCTRSNSARWTAWPSRPAIRN